jgi:hypothetical protein
MKTYVKLAPGVEGVFVYFWEDVLRYVASILEVLVITNSPSRTHDILLPLF